MDNLDFRFGYDGLSPVPCPPSKKKRAREGQLGTEDLPTGQFIPPLHAGLMFRGHLEPQVLGASLVLLIKFNDSPAFTILLHMLKCFSTEEKLKQDLYF